jgi:hypothetical protein
MREFVWIGLAFMFAAADAAELGDRRDSDRDGVPDESDRCVSTPWQAEPILQGCAVIELIARPEIFADPVRAALDTAARGVVLEGVSDDHDRESAHMRRDLEGAASRFDAAARELGQGELCVMAETTAGVRDSLEEISRRSHELLLTTRTALQHRVGRDEGDADFAEVAFHELGYRASLVGQALVAVRVAHDIADRACGRILRPSRWTGIVTRTDDAARIMELTGERVFVLPVGAATPGEGAHVRVEGVELDHGTDRLLHRLRWRRPARAAGGRRARAPAAVHQDAHRSVSALPSSASGELELRPARPPRLHRLRRRSRAELRIADATCRFDHRCMPETVEPDWEVPHVSLQPAASLQAAGRAGLHRVRLGSHALG